MKKVKICGITCLDDALAAVEAGADYLGFNFYPPSPRYITPFECARVLAGLGAHGGSVYTVGVFVNETVVATVSILDDCGLDLAQLSGDELPEAVQALDGRGFKAIRPQTQEQVDRLASQYAASQTKPALLVDAYRSGLYGGTGHTGDWTLARRLAERHPILLAGGLHPGNVAQAVAQADPWGVDVASGVESSPGRKDPQKMRDFIRAVHHISQEVSS